MIIFSFKFQCNTCLTVEKLENTDNQKNNNNKSLISITRDTHCYFGLYLLNTLVM